jgi:formamidopyrimidine-DNA glycosylase
MPELPEVETMRRGIAAIAGRCIEDIRQPKSKLQSIEITPRLADFRRRATGCKILSVGRIGKRVVLELDCPDRIVLEPRMSGLIMLAEPPDDLHLRLVFDLSGDSAAAELLFWDQRGLGVVRLVSPEQFLQHYGPDKVGPDALEISAETLRQRLGKSTRAVKVALLDQQALAGVGNLYASEILHRAGIHPATACRRLRPAQWGKIHAVMREVLDAAILHKGSTLRDGTYRIARSQAGSYQHCHWVYQRAGERCQKCGRAEIVRVVQCGRSTFFCPACQRAPRGD